MIIDIDSYFRAKGVSSLVFTDVFEPVFNFYNGIIGFTEQTLHELISFIEKYNNCFDSVMKANVLSIIDYFRNSYCKEHPEEKKTIWNLCNVAVSRLNIANDSCIEIFVAVQLQSRNFSDEHVARALKIIDSSFSFVKDLNVDDFYLLYYHSDLADETSFIENIKAFSHIYYDYISNISCILKECPELWLDETFFKRVNIINMLLYENIETACKQRATKKYAKQLKKRYNNYIKDFDELNKATE